MDRDTYDPESIGLHCHITFVMNSSWSGEVNHLTCHFSQCPAGGGRVWHKEKGEASAEFSEILPRLQAAQGVGAPHPGVTAPTGRWLLGTSCGKTSQQTHCVYQLWITHLFWTQFLLLQHMLSKVGTWNFDIFLFDRLTNGKTAFCTTENCYMLHWFKYILS